MKAGKVLEKLNVTRKTLNSYVKLGKVRVKELGNGFYDYDEENEQGRRVRRKGLPRVRLHGGAGQGTAACRYGILQETGLIKLNLKEISMKKTYTKK